MGFLRKITRSIGRAAGGVFEDITKPFVKPIDNLLDAITPFRFKFSGDIRTRSNVNVAGGTRHDIVFPNFPLAPGAGRPIGDITGGLLSDLAFDSNEIRRAESELKFLSKAMKKGLYPHRQDAFYLRVRAVPLESIGSDIWVETTVSDDSGVIAESAFLAEHKPIKNQYAVAKARLGVVDENELHAEVMLEESMSLPIARGQASEIKLEMIFRQRDATAHNPAMAKQFAAVTISIERENESYTDVLHFLEVDLPKDRLTVRFHVDRKEYISKNAEQMAALNFEGGALVTPGNHLNSAAGMLSELGQIKPPPAGSIGSTAVMDYLLQRTQAAEKVRDKLFEARRAISRFRINDNATDFRLRHKIRLENLTTTAVDIEQVKFECGSKGGSGISSIWDMSDFQLPPASEYETTVYPLQEYDDSTSKFSVRVKGADQNKVRVRMSLVTGIGDAELIVRSRMLTAQDADTLEQMFEWAIGDTVAT